MINRLMKQFIWKIIKIMNKFGSCKQCCVCKSTFFCFTRYKGGLNKKSNFIKSLDIVGSDVDNFGCMFCHSHDRERHLFMFFDKLKIWSEINNLRILHFAPERHLSAKIEKLEPILYIKADLNPDNSDVLNIDATNIIYKDNSFDLIIANHILEHIANYSLALSEFYRVLNYGGFVILQTPYSKVLKNNFEDEGINSDKLRSFFYGQSDHVRVFGWHQLFRSLENVGFRLSIVKHSDLFTSNDSYFFGVSSNEDLIIIIK